MRAYRSFGVIPVSCGRRGPFGLAFLALALALGLALAGCGRRGDLEPPPDTPASQVVPLQTKNINPMAGDPAQPGHKPTPANANAGAQAVSGNTFLLDPLVK
jgi:predicted small lipoprotein YifL